MAMFKSTLFIALQCCQCSTMQVKQQKKSSNKWTCVVCNQKQSVKKVYAQGYQAKQIRQFVQSFNMGRKFANDQDSSLGHFVEHFEGNVDDEDKRVEKGTDWSEYMENEQDNNPVYLKSKSKEDGEFEPEIVTELPDERMFKKPKLKGKYNSSSTSSGSGDCKVYKPQFPKRNTNERTCSQRAATKEITKTQQMLSTVEPVRTESLANNNNLLGNVPRGWQKEQGQNRLISTAKRGASKWSDYMEEDQADCFEGGTAAFADDLKLMCRYNLETDVTDQRVEEDIHPDFM